MFFQKKYEVKPNQKGYLFRANNLETILDAGIHKVYDWKAETECICLPTTSKLIQIAAQEILSKDNIAFRVSFVSQYKIKNGEQFLTQFELNKPVAYLIAEFEQRLYNAIQVKVRNIFAALDSEEINENRAVVGNMDTQLINTELINYGVELDFVTLRDISFPKSIQDLFAKHLEAKIRSKSDLENARTTVATARALKNAADLMKDDDNIKFMQYIELISKIAEKGKHTFLVGEVTANQLKMK
jgi:regulator of protease activity HflC (stomatin/prohibitin superfamily)